jgi:hypothetical protein
LLKEVESLTEKIKESDRKIEQIAREDYQETALLQQVGGVGRREKQIPESRDVGCYIGSCSRGAVIRVNANRSYASLRTVIPICERCWCKEHFTFLAVVDAIPI